MELYGKRVRKYNELQTEQNELRRKMGALFVFNEIAGIKDKLPKG